MTVAATVILPLLTLQPAKAEEPGSQRHGVVPMIGSPLYWERAINRVAAKDLHYGGGAVYTSAPKVYLVFYGSQWGSQSTDANGNTKFSGDPDGMAGALQQFFKGLGTGNELWSGVMTQYCDGAARNATKCAASASHIAYPTGGALKGVWGDNTVSSPAAASSAQLGQEAEKAATHFGNTTSASNADAVYMIVSPTGTDPDNYKSGGFCAWHDDNSDVGVGGSTLAFTNLPYLPDAGAGCGAGFVNSGDKLDGVTIVAGHEYAETLTDPYPPSGWYNNSYGETGDICAWLSTGAGRVQDITLTTGKFAVQGTWSNLGATCSVSHAIVK
jgi:serine protease